MNCWLGLSHCLGHEQGCVSYYSVQERLGDTEDPFWFCSPLVTWCFVSQFKDALLGRGVFECH